MENVEKRERTRNKMRNALIDLCDEKSYLDITIANICDQAGVYRSTFYRYYETKDELLREIEHDYVEQTRRLTPNLCEYRPDASLEMRKIYFQELATDMGYHLQNEKICRFLLSPAGDIYFRQKMVDSIGETVTRCIKRYGYRKTKELNYLISFFSAGFVSTIYEWLKVKDRTPEQIAGFLLDMITLLQP